MFHAKKRRPASFGATRCSGAAIRRAGVAIRCRTKVEPPFAARLAHSKNAFFQLRGKVFSTAFFGLHLEVFLPEPPEKSTEKGVQQLGI